MRRLLSITVEDVQLADGTRLVGSEDSSKSEELRKRVETLKASRPGLEDKIKHLETELGSKSI